MPHSEIIISDEDVRAAVLPISDDDPEYGRTILALLRQRLALSDAVEISYVEWHHDRLLRAWLVTKLSIGPRHGSTTQGEV